MVDGKQGREGQPRDAGRRALLKAATVAGGAVAASALLPGSWKKPVATVGGLPAHAQTSQTLTLSRPEAYIMSPLGARIDVEQIEGRCRYDDALGDFDATHQITFSVSAGDLQAQGGGGALGNGVCGTPFTSTLADIPHKILGDGSTGELRFIVETACFPPGAVSWQVHKGSHASNVVNATIRRPDRT